jgi:hypothetical protein
VTGNNLNRAQQQKNFRGVAPFMFLILVQAFWDPLRGELPRVQIFMNGGPTRSREIHSCSAIHLAEIQPAVFQD